MKRFFCCLLILSLLSAVSGGMLTGASPTASAAGETEELPSIFHNDEAWYKDGAAPLLCRKDVYYVPAELFDLFENIRVTSPTEENLLICNTSDDRYISILFEKSRAAVNGEIAENISVFRDGGVTYVDAVQVAGTVGIMTEMIPQENGRITMRLTDGSELLTTEELLASYFPEEPADEFAGLEEEENRDLKRIFILCREPSPDTEDSALDMLHKYNMGYTLFLSAETSMESLLHALAGGEYGILTDGSGDGTETVEQLNTINERFGRITHYRTHFTMSTGNISADEKLIAAAYCPVAPDFIVDSSADADTMFADMLQYLEEEYYCFLLLEDCDQTEQMLKLLNQIDREKYITSNLGH